MQGAVELRGETVIRRRVDVQIPARQRHSTHAAYPHPAAQRVNNDNVNDNDK